MEHGELKQLTMNHLTGGYQINNGDMSTMTPLQLVCVSCISNIIYNYKMDNKPFAVI